MLIRIVALVLVFGLVVGCAPKKVEQEGVETVAPEPTMTPLEQFVGTADIGTQSLVSGTRYGDVRVRIVEQYFSALGQTCRRVDVTNQNECGMELIVCRNADGDWKEKPMLWDGCSR